jgi:hypothetical protein
VQLALRSGSSGQVLRPGPRRLMAAGVAVVGASLIAANPLAPNVAADIQHKVVADIQHRAVQLTAGGSDVVGTYDSLVNTTYSNLQTLGAQAGIAFPRLLNQVGANLQGTGSLFNTAMTGTQTGLQNAIFNGWYGSDDGYVFGLYGGTLTHAGVTESGSTVGEIVSSLSQGNVFNAFGYFDEWSLEAAEHVSEPLMSPFISTARAGATPTPTIPAQFLQTTANVYNAFFNFPNVKNLSQALLSPPISVTFGLLSQIGTIGGDVSSLNFAGALTDVAKAPANVVGDVLNGYVYPGQYNPNNSPFTGLLNSGSLFQQLLYTFPNQLATALGAKTTGSATGAAASLGGLSQITSLLPNLANVAQPSLLAGNLGATFGPLLANIAAQLSATLAPNLVSGLLLHLPALLLALL